VASWLSGWLFSKKDSQTERHTASQLARTQPDSQVKPSQAETGEGIRARTRQAKKGEVKACHANISEIKTEQAMPGQNRSGQANTDQVGQSQDSQSQMKIGQPSKK